MTKKQDAFEKAITDAVDGVAADYLDKYFDVEEGGEVTRVSDDIFDALSAVNYKGNKRSPQAAILRPGPEAPAAEPDEGDADDSGDDNSGVVIDPSGAVVSGASPDPDDDSVDDDLDYDPQQMEVLVKILESHLPADSAKSKAFEKIVSWGSSKNLPGMDKAQGLIKKRLADFDKAELHSMVTTMLGPIPPSKLEEFPKPEPRDCPPELRQILPDEELKSPAMYFFIRDIQLNRSEHYDYALEQVQKAMNSGLTETKKTLSGIVRAIGDLEDLIRHGLSISPKDQPILDTILSEIDSFNEDDITYDSIKDTVRQFNRWNIQLLSVFDRNTSDKEGQAAMMTGQAGRRIHDSISSIDTKSPDVKKTNLIAFRTLATAHLLASEEAVGSAPVRVKKKHLVKALAKTLVEHSILAEEDMRKATLDRTVASIEPETTTGAIMPLILSDLGKKSGFEFLNTANASGVIAALGKNATEKDIAKAVAQKQIPPNKLPILIDALREIIEENEYEFSNGTKVALSPTENPIRIFLALVRVAPVYRVLNELKGKKLTEENCANVVLDAIKKEADGSRELVKKFKEAAEAREETAAQESDDNSNVPATTGDFLSKMVLGPAGNFIIGLIKLLFLKKKK